MKIALGIAVLIGLGIAAPAPAEPDQQRRQIMMQLSGQGFEDITITGARRIEVAAHRGDRTLRLVYDGQTGRLLEKSFGPREEGRRSAFRSAAGDDRRDPGRSVRLTGDNRNDA